MRTKQCHTPPRDPSPHNPQVHSIKWTHFPDPDVYGPRGLRIQRLLEMDSEVLRQDLNVSLSFMAWTANTFASKQSKSRMDVARLRFATERALLQQDAYSTALSEPSLVFELYLRSRWELPVAARDRAKVCAHAAVPTARPHRNAQLTPHPYRLRLSG